MPIEPQWIRPNGFCEKKAAQVLRGGTLFRVKLERCGFLQGGAKRRLGAAGDGRLGPQRAVGRSDEHPCEELPDGASP
ncbi:MAG: hypothetical protein OXN89_14340 [Bryobacterales bacterium]|nr:hypothetical protein [Bryobacterales bacterium]